MLILNPLRDGPTPRSSSPIPTSLHILLSLETAPNLSFPAVAIKEAELKLLRSSAIKPTGQFLILLHITSDSVSNFQWKSIRTCFPITFIELICGAFDVEKWGFSSSQQR